MKKYFLLFILLIIKVNAQEIPKPNEIFSSLFLTNFNIVLNNGEIIENGSILIENGIIKKFGSNLTNNNSSFIVDGKNQYLYPGFFDAGYLFKPQLPKSSDTLKRSPGNPTYENSGITPEIFASDFYHSERKNYEKIYSNGFTTNLFLPNLGMLSGKATIIALHKGKVNNEIIKNDVGIYAKFSSARGYNPSTIMGLMAKYRQLFFDAEDYKNRKNNYEKFQTARPEFDPVLEELIKIRDKKTTLFFEANSESEIRRILQLKKEFGFNFVLVGGREVHKTIKELKSENIPVILSLNIPENQTDTMKFETSLKDYSDFIIKDEIEALKERQKQARLEIINNAKILKENGIKYAFASLDTKNENIKKNMIELINEGLSEQELINALTIYPSDIFHLSNKLGKIEEGKFASFFISDKPFFDKKSKVKAVVIDGIYYEIEQKQTSNTK